MQSTSNISGTNNEGFQIGQNTGQIFVFDRQNRKTADKATTDFVQTLASHGEQTGSISSPEPGTCKWFLQDAKFVEWREASGSRLLHLLAGPGCGKSVLTRYLIQEKLLSSQDDFTILYFFFKTGQGQQDRSTSAVCAMLHQAFTQRSKADINSYALQKFEELGAKFLTSFHELWNVLLSTISDISGTVVCVFEALDECKEQDRHQLMEAISNVYATVDQSQAIQGTPKFFISSRPYQAVDFDYWPMGNPTNKIVLDADDERSEAIASDINRVIERRVPYTVPKVPHQVQNAIIEHLQSMRNRTYLWLNLTLHFIKEHSALHGTETRLKELLKQLPPTVSDAYEAMLCRSKNQKQARKLLSIVIAAKRPLSLAEMKVALHLTEQEYQYLEEIDTESDEKFKESIRDICGLLLSIHESKVYFIHETARDFLIKQESLSEPKEPSWRQSIQYADAEAVLAEACILYLALKDFQKLPPWGDSEMYLMQRISQTSTSGFHELGLLDLFPDWTRQHVFLTYAATWWSTHFRICQDSLFEKLKDSLMKILPGFSNASRIWFPIMSLIPEVGLESMRARTALGFAAQEGLHILSKELIELGVEIDEHSDRLGAPLQVAILRGHTEIVRLLLAHGANVNTESGAFGSALQAAVWSGNRHIVALLIEHGADVNVQGGIMYGSALMAALGFGSPEIVRLLLESGATANVVCRHCLTTRAEKEASVCVLAPGHPPSEDEGVHYLSALAAAMSGYGSEKEKFTVMEVLLEFEPEIDIFFEKAQTVALDAGYDDIMQLLEDYREKASLDR